MTINVKKNRTFGVSGFHHVALRVKDFNKSIKFYREALGFDVKINFPHTRDKNIKIAMMDVGDGNYIEIFSDSKTGKIDTESAGCWFHIAFRTEDVDEIVERAKKFGVPVTREPSDVVLDAEVQTPIRAAFISGPDGESIEFLKNIDEKGIIL